MQLSSGHIEPITLLFCAPEVLDIGHHIFFAASSVCIPHPFPELPEGSPLCSKMALSVLFSCVLEFPTSQPWLRLLPLVAVLSMSALPSLRWTRRDYVTGALGDVLKSLLLDFDAIII